MSTVSSIYPRLHLCLFFRPTFSLHLCFLRSQAFLGGFYFYVTTGKLLIMNLLMFFLPLFVVGCDLKCFLAGLEVNIGSLSYAGRFALSKYSVDIADLKCGNISMASFDSGWNGEQEYTLGVLGVGIDCLGGYVAKWGLLHEHGEVSAGGGGGNINAASLLVNNHTSGMAEGITMTACQSSFVIDVWFTGPKWLQDLEKDFHRRLQKDISDAVNKAACNFLRELDADQVTQWIQVLNSDLTTFLEPPTPAMWPLAPWDARLQSMENSSFVNLLDFLVERLLGPQGINGALAVVNLTHIEFPIRTHFAPIVGRGANATFALEQLDVQGAFDTWTAFSLKPAGDYAVRFTAAIAGPLEFTLLFAGNVTTTTGGDTFNSKGTIKFVISNITFDFNALVYANASFYDELSFVGLENCPLNGMINVGILRLFTDLTVQSFNVSSLSPNGGLEDSFAAAVDDAFRMIIANYRQFIPPFVDAFLETMVQPRVDEILQNSLLGKNDSCAQTPQQRDTEATVGLNMMAVIVSLSAWSFVLIIIWITLWCVEKRNAGLSLAWAEDTSTIAKVLVPATAVFCFSVNMITAASTSAALRLRLGFGPNVLVSSALYTMVRNVMYLLLILAHAQTLVISPLPLRTWQVRYVKHGMQVFTKWHLLLSCFRLLSLILSSYLFWPVGISPTVGGMISIVCIYFISSIAWDAFNSFQDL